MTRKEEKIVFHPTLMQPQYAVILRDALRSGTYEQTKNVLRKENKFCALGVLCDTLGARWILCGPLLKKDEYHVEGRSFPDIGVEIHTPNGIRGIGALNDSGATFAQIADMLDYHILQTRMLEVEAKRGTGHVQADTPWVFQADDLVVASC